MQTLSPPTTPPSTNTNEHKCSVCKKIFKNKAGLMRHNTVIRKYNTLREGLPVVPTSLTELFKNDLIYFIHRRLPNGFKNAGKKMVSIPCSESQFHAIFENHIHFYSKKSDNHILHQKTETNPLALATIKKASSAVKPKKSFSKYKYGEIVIEWKRKRDKDAMGNICSAGFIYFHFFTKQAYII
ncbi:hypothetical protein GLOIN_2v1799445 [Rhizophagus irregularis DAOM 181602=DAOM 197198]|nr:hypothetical protein GLOIN_2v1799445 [Rhizophagus irregularis DAOM 181602=DAOM 197198]